MAICQCCAMSNHGSDIGSCTCCAVPRVLTSCVEFPGREQRGFTASSLRDLIGLALVRLPVVRGSSLGIKVVYSLSTEC
eukprot:1289368-Rhodomonas_salina.2